VKSFLTILISLLLGGTPSFGRDLSAASKQRCGARCACSQKACCVDQSGADTTPQPVAPAAGFSLKLPAWALPVSAQGAAPPAVAAQSVRSPLTCFARSTAVPLYAWNCAYLI
jgi:hypothetical protein